MTGIGADTLALLHQPTPPERIKQRQGPGGRTLDYVDARYVMDKLDELGPENWQDLYVQNDPNSVLCGIGINIDGQWIWKYDVGTPSDIESEKGAHSDAFKRAAVKWGIGRDLYGPHSSNGTGRAGTPLPARPAAVPRPQSAPVEPDWMSPPSADADEDQCPAHGVDWRKGKYGWFCPSKAGPDEEQNTRGYCALVPTAAWQQAHAA